MAGLMLDRLTWPEVREELNRGRTAVVIAFGATEQHGPHLALSTDRVLGEELARRVGDALDAFVAPTVPFGCSSHHLAFPGTMSLRDETFHAIVADVVSSFAGAGFRRIVLLPSHGGNFAPLGAAVEKLEVPDGVRIDAITDLAVLASIPVRAAEQFSVPVSEGGLHAGEWETSMILATRPELVHMERAEGGYTGDLQESMAKIFAGGVDAISQNGVIGDPARASAAHGETYWTIATQMVLDAIA
jgi:creatinine amidohydrolase